MALLALFLMVPQSWTLIEPLVRQMEQTLDANPDANLPAFFTAFLLAIGATVISWLTMRWPRREAPEPCRVVQRFRIG